MPHRRADTTGCGAGVLDVLGALRALEASMDDDEEDAGDGDPVSHGSPARHERPGNRQQRHEERQAEEDDG